ncbi:GNAT family N-acetyltransferase [Loigolactobacillus binensis]|uniref:GNAT family N-acetyltransferase n=1 Tax=Loigolactobacillus binensis TaxID=2559922 RepID=A0ABW3EFJ2_9LACO|nr:GNAT family N-acetyltransferase [Loigolactobacillus binensis]
MDDSKLIIKKTSELTNFELLDILKARTAVFVVEQNCPYQEVDDQDYTALHVMLKVQDQLAAYARIIPHQDNVHISFGRVLVVKAFRGQQLGRQLVTATIAATKRYFPDQAIKIAGQSYLKAFYMSFGFKPVSAVYLEDNIPHIDFVLAA